MKKIFDSETKTILRIDKDEEVIASLSSFAKGRDASCHFSLIGGASEVVIGFYDTEQKQYLPKVIGPVDNIEILGVQGTVAWEGGEPVVHAHGTFSDQTYAAVGGHVLKIIIAITGEVVIDWLPQKLERELVEGGLKLFK